jgi:hypothetical protein
MASSQAVYTITITNGITGSTPNDGFVDNLRIEDYYGSAGLVTTPSGLTLALCKAKVRANVRYREIINQLAIVSNCYVAEKADIVGTNTTPNVVAAAATGKVEPTSFIFKIIVEHGDASLSTPDELNAGQFLTSTNCIKRCVARALTNDMLRQEPVFDPTSANSVGVWGATTSVPRYGIRIYDNTFEVGAYATDIPTAEANITVVQRTF